MHVRVKIFDTSKIGKIVRGSINENAYRLGMWDCSDMVRGAIANRSKLVNEGVVN